MVVVVLGTVVVGGTVVVVAAVVDGTVLAGTVVVATVVLGGAVVGGSVVLTGPVPADRRLGEAPHAAATAARPPSPPSFNNRRLVSVRRCSSTLST